MEAAAINHPYNLNKMIRLKAAHYHAPGTCRTAVGSFDSCLSFDVLVKVHHRTSSRLKKSTSSSRTRLNPADTVETSAHGVSAIRNFFHLHVPFAVSDSAPSFPLAGVLVCPSWRSACRAGPTSTHLTCGAVSQVGVDLASLFPGTWPSGSDTAG